MLQRLGIRGKLLAVVAVPVLLLLVTMGFIVVSNVGDYRADANAQQLVQTLAESRDVKIDLQKERQAGVNFVHTIETATANLGVRELETANRYDVLAAEVDRADDPRADKVLSDVTAALGGKPGAGMLETQRALDLTPPEAAGEWVGFPTEEETVAQQESYLAVATSLDEIAAASADDLDLRRSVAALTVSVEQEAALYVDLLQTPLDYQTTLTSTFETVNSGLDRIAEQAAKVRRTEENEAALAGVAAGSVLRTELPALREGIMAAQASPQTLTQYYTDLIAAFESATSAIAIAAPNSELISAIQGYAAVDAFIEDLLYEEIVFERMIRDGAFSGSDAANSRTIVERTRIGLETAQNSVAGVPGDPVVVPPFGASVDVSSPGISSFESIRNRITNGLDSSLVSAQRDNWPTKVSAELAQYEPIRDDILNRTLDSAESSTNSARNIAVVVSIIAVVAIVFTLLLAFAIARRISVPLRRLTTTAAAVREELPRLVERVAIPGEDVDVSDVQIPVDSDDEVGRLAEAFNGVNAATLEIAREQAALRGSISEMFVNVARRDQVLLNRQLASIDEMERTEDDPNRLTKLFALDHLATRMRRNSESLLVLAGIDTGRRIRRAMPLSDVVRTASSEIELYERVDLELVVDPAMLGHQALTAAHLFAELLENATVFSDPGSRVIIRTGRTVDGFTVEVIDSGIGMTPEEFAEANARVQSTAASEILGAQRLGLFVVGRIARRLGAHVALAPREGGGTVATVLLPAVLFEVASANEGDQSRPAADAYLPSTMVEGTALAGRQGADDPAESDLPIPMPTPTALEALIAADAAAAPVAVPVSGADMVGGVSAGGLPTRRRRDESAEAAGDEQAVIGLPVRATAAQLSALEAEQAPFTPPVPATELAPQTPEARSAVFRGFRSSRESALVDAPAVADDAAFAVPALVADGPVDGPAEGLVEAAPEAVADAPVANALPTRPTAAQLGGAFAAFDAIRRANAAGPGVPVAAEPAAPEARVVPDGAVVADGAVVPETTVLPDGAVVPHAAQPAAPLAEAPVAPEATLPAAPAAALPVFSMPKLAEPAVAPAAESATSPLARSPYGAAFAAAESAAAPVVPVASVEPVVPIAPVVPEVDVPMVVPMLEPDPEPVVDLAPVAVEPEPAVVPALEPDPSFTEPTYVEPAYTPAWGAPAQVVSPAAAAPVVPVAPVWANQPVAPVAPVAPAQPVQAAVPVETAMPVEADEPVAPVASPAPAFFAPAPAPSPAPAAAAPAYVPPHTQESLDDIIAQASGEEAGRAGFFGRLFGKAKGHDEPATAASTPVKSTAFAPTSFDPASLGSQGVPAPAPLGVPSAASAFEPAPVAPEPTAPAAFPAAFTPAGGAAFMPAPASATEPAAIAPEPTGDQSALNPTAPNPTAPYQPAQASAPMSFTPQELAQPRGWEAAGESAIAAADGDSGEYTPVLDTNNSSGRSFADDEADVTRAAFSELSSLSETRPKVEKTRSGLQRRRKVDEPPAAVEPIAEDVTLAPKERDAEAVRSRFSNFYSGTQRARNDAAELDQRSKQQPTHG